MSRYRFNMMIPALLLLSGCGGGASDDALTGKFIDSPVMGLAYRTESFDSMTNADGEFQYLPGETIEFSIGKLSLGKTEAREIITPFSLINAGNISQPEGINRLRLLQSLDADQDPANGIRITNEAHRLAPALSANDMLWSGARSGDNASFDNWIQTNYFAHFGSPPELVSTAAALFHFQSEKGGAANSPRYSLGGSVYGLRGELVLSNQGLEAVTIQSPGEDANFTLATPYLPGSPYFLQVVQQPVGQFCEISNPDGFIGTVNLDTLTVVCTDNTRLVRVSASGLDNALMGGLLLRDSNNRQIMITQNGAGEVRHTGTDVGFSGELNVIAPPPSHLCAAELIPAATVNDIQTINLHCEPRRYQVSVVPHFTPELQTHYADMGRSYVVLENLARGIQVSHIFQSADEHQNVTPLVLDVFYDEEISLRTGIAPTGMVCSLGVADYQNPDNEITARFTAIESTAVTAIPSYRLYCDLQHYRFEVTASELGSADTVSLNVLRNDLSSTASLSGSTPFVIADLRANETLRVEVADGTTPDYHCSIDNGFVTWIVGTDQQVQLRCIMRNTFVWQLTNRDAPEQAITLNGTLDIQLTDNTTGSSTQLRLADQTVAAGFTQQISEAELRLRQDGRTYSISIIEQALDLSSPDITRDQYCVIGNSGVRESTVLSGFGPGRNYIDIQCFAPQSLAAAGIDMNLIAQCDPDYSAYTANGRPGYTFQVQYLEDVNTGGACNIGEAFSFDHFSALTELRSINLNASTPTAQASALDLRELVDLSRLNAFSVNQHNGEALDTVPALAYPMSAALKSCVDNAGRGWVSVNDVDHLDCSGQNLSDLTGLWMLRGLQSLRLADTQILSVDEIRRHAIRPDVAGLESTLHSLDLRNNPLSAGVSGLADLSGLRNLDIGFSCEADCSRMLNLDNLGSLINLEHVRIDNTNVTTPALTSWLENGFLRMPVLTTFDTRGSNVNLVHSAWDAVRNQFDITLGSVMPALVVPAGSTASPVAINADSVPYQWGSQHRFEIDIEAAAETAIEIDLSETLSVANEYTSRQVFAAVLPAGIHTLSIPESCGDCLADFLGRTIDDALNDFRIQLRNTGTGDLTVNSIRLVQ